MYDFFWINDAYIESTNPLTGRLPAGSDPWCIEAGQTVEVQLSVTASTLSGSVIAELFIDGQSVARAQSEGQESLSLIYKETVDSDVDAFVLISATEGPAVILAE